VNFRGAKALVLGMAKSGVASARLLREHGAEVTATDLRPLHDLTGLEETLEPLGVPFRQQTPELFELAWDVVVLSPGVPADLPELSFPRERGALVIGDVELAGYYLQGPVIGITGSNGKTTTTALTAHILKAAGIPCQLGGNIGLAVGDMVKASSPTRWNVLELSSFQLEMVEKFKASVGVCLNVTPDHLDRHGTFEDYADCKAKLFTLQDSSGLAVLNADDPTCVEFASRTPARPVWFSVTRPVTPGAWLADGQLIFDDKPFLQASEIPLKGLHNVENTLAAAVAARLAGATLEEIAAAVRSFPGVEHRLEFVRTVDGVAFYNDSKATNVDATRKALDAFEGQLWVILGGKDKGSDYTVLAEPLRRKARGVLLVGAAAGKIRSHLQEATLPSSVEVVDVGTIPDAVEQAFAKARSGEIVLLAPACASFDQFTSFEHRGRVFKESVQQLRAREGS
jgi:UDP-N-acetylmuramoylalanine--D-glutamate ligase